MEKAPRRNEREEQQSGLLPTRDLQHSLGYLKVTAALPTVKAKGKTAGGRERTHGPFSPLNGPSDVGHPRVPLLFGAGVNFVHLGPSQGGADQKHGFLLVGHFPHNELL